MELKIFNVEHGFCAYLVSDNRNVMLIDCGHNTSSGFRPSEYLPRTGCTGIEALFVLNYDEDHVSDLPSLVDRLPISVVWRNASIGTDELRRLKQHSGGIGRGVSTALELFESGDPVTDPSVLPEFQSIEYAAYCNSYPEFATTNDLSMVLFVRAPGLSVAFTGDLEYSGWRNLLKQREFREELARVNVFVASHHGRASGYEPEVFRFCKPDIVVISDEQLKYDSQEVDYSRHAYGVNWEGGGVRKVLTTRRDGTITIRSVGDTAYRIQTEC